MYEIGGERRTAAMETDCRRRLETGGRVSDDGYRTVVDLTGTIPEGATGVRLVVESETGTDIYPIEP